MVYNRRRE